MASLSRGAWGWGLYDFGNSAFATSILSVIFSVYLVQELIPEEGLWVLGFTIPGESVWGYLIALVMVFVILMSPGLGRLADEKGVKKLFLLKWTLIGSLATLGLITATADHLTLTLLLIFTATLSYEMSLVFYNALLNDVATPENKGRISGFGYAIGYIGGGLFLGFNMVLIGKPEMFGLEAGTTLPHRIGFALVGVWWMVFSIPLLRWVQEGKDKEAVSLLTIGPAMINAFQQLKQTLLYVIQRPNLGRFLLAYVIYNDGIQTVLLMASIFGAKALGMSAVQLGLCFLLIQFVAFFGAVGFGRLADQWSHKKVVLVTLAVYIAAVTWAVFMRSATEYWVLGVIIGLVLGGSQAATRSLFANLIPKEKSGELFAFYAVVGKAAAMMGPFFFAITSQNFGLRAGVASLLVFFVVGGALLLKVKEA